MKFLFSILMMVSVNGFAAEATCDLVNGFYRNSPQDIQEIRFETVVDLFTINNARALNFTLEGEQMRFLRSDITVSRQTKLIYLMRKEKNGATRKVYVLLDRTPRDVARTNVFYGNMIISAEVKNQNEIRLGNASGALTYNFFCKI